METLADRIDEGGALPTEEAVHWVLRLVLALEPLHRRGGAHGAVGANSVHLASGPLEIDKLADPRTAASLAMYHSPERARGGSISPSDDTWAVAVTLFYALTGAWPYSGETDLEVDHAIRDSIGITLAEHGIEDSTLDGLLSRALRPERMARVLMLPVLREQLEDWLVEWGGETLDVRPLDLEGAVIDAVPNGPTSQLDSHEVNMPETRRLEEDADASVTDVEAAMKMRGALAIHAISDMAETRRVGLDDMLEPPRSRPPSMVIAPRSERPPPVQKGAPPALDDLPPTMALPDVAPPPEVADEDEEDVPPTKLSLPPVLGRAEVESPPTRRSSRPPKSKRASRPPKSKRAPPSTAAPTAAHSKDLPPSVSSGLGVRSYVAIGVVLGAGAGVFAASVSTSETPPTPLASAELATPSAVAPAPQARASVSAETMPSATASAVASASSPAPASPSPAALVDGDVSACVAPLFAEGSFEDVPDLSIICDIDDPRRGADRMREAVVRGGVGRKISAGMREWAVMGWFELASFTVMRAHCCAGAPPVTLPNSPGACPSMADALNALGDVVASEGDDAALEAAIDGYATAVRCLNRAGATKLFGGHPQLAGGEEPAFRKTLERARGKR